MKIYVKSNAKIAASYDYDTFNELCNNYSMYDTMSLADIWEEINTEYEDEDLANDVVSEVESIRDRGW